MPYALEPGYLSSILDSIQMGYLGLVIGVIIASVLAYFAASNITPSKKIGYVV
jgi:phosphonate transport system permease protein